MRPARSSAATRHRPTRTCAGLTFSFLSEEVGSDERPGLGGEQRHPTKQALLDATIADMEATGEASIRVMKVLKDAGASNGSIFYHFGSRVGRGRPDGDFRLGWSCWFATFELVS